MATAATEMGPTIAARAPDRWAIPDGTFGPAWLDMMEPNSPAEELPALYRAILDRVADLESDGARTQAARVRASATKIYSRAWDERARKELMALLRGATRPGSGEPVMAANEPLTHGIRSKSAAAS